MDYGQPQNQQPQTDQTDPQPQSQPQPEPQLEPQSTPVRKKERNLKTSILLAIIALLVIAVGVLTYLLMNQENSVANNNAKTATVEQEDQKGNVDADVDEVADADKSTGEKTKPADPTADWQTLTSEKYDISFKHPKGNEWVAAVNDWPISSGQIAFGSVKYVPCGPNCGWALTFRIVNKGTSDDPGETFGEKRLQGNDAYSLVSKKSVTKDGINGTRWEYKPSSNEVANTIYYYFVRGDRAYAFEVNMNGSFTGEIDITKTGDLIMDTLSFTS